MEEYNTACAVNAAMAVMVEDSADVRLALAFAQQHGMKVAVKSTGHDYDCRSSAPDAVLINLSRMHSIDGPVDGHGVPAITVQPGVRWGAVYGHMKGSPYVVVGGADKSVGVSGWHLGGGHGTLSRRYGLGADQMLRATIVTADGCERNVSSEENTDLFWAMRGGGSSWGIMTSLTIRVHKSPGYIATRTMNFFDAPPSEETVRMIGSWIASAPAKAHAYWYFPRQLYAFYDLAGEPMSAAKTAFEGLDSITDASADFTLPLDFYTLISVFPECGDCHGPKATTNNFLDADSFESKDVAVELRRAYLDNVFDNCTGSFVLGGAAKKPDDTETAINPKFRNALVTMTCMGPATNSENHHAWANSTFNQLGNGGSYMNEPQHDRGDWQDVYWGEKYSRLLAVKSKWDPQGIFTLHHGVGDGELRPRVEIV